MVSRTSRNFGKVRDAVKIPDLVAIQRESYGRFLQRDAAPTKRKCIGLEDLFREIFPIESYDKTMCLEYLYYELEQPRYTPTECRQLRLTYGYPLKISCRMRRQDGEDLTEQAIYLGEMPIMIGGGEFIINGAERVIVSQLHRSPGVDFVIDSKEGDRILHGGRIIPERGSWIEITVTHKDTLVVKIDQSSKIPATIFLRAISADYGSTESILRLFYETKNVPVDKLTPTMWAVGPIVDSETGEIIVKAGAQISDKVSIIQQSEINVDRTKQPSSINGERTKEIGQALKKYGKGLKGFFELSEIEDAEKRSDIEKLLKSNPLALVIWVFCMQHNVKAKISSMVPLKMKNKFEKLEVGDIASKSIEEIVDFVKIGQFDTKNLAKGIKQFCERIRDNYKGDVQRFWANRKGVEVIEEFREFPGIGPKIAPLLAIMLQRHYGVEFPDPEEINIAADFQVAKAMKMLGLVDDPENKNRVRDIVRRLNPKYPGELDAPLWELGRRFGEFEPEEYFKELGLKYPVQPITKKGSSNEGVEVIEQVSDALILNTLADDDCPSHEQALLKFYIRLRPGNPPNEEKAKAFFEEKFFDMKRYRLGRVGRFRLNRKFGQKVDESEMTLRPEDFLNTMRYVMRLRNPDPRSKGELDDIDHLGNRRLRTIDELAADEIRKGLLKLRKTVQERMSFKREGQESVRIADLVNSKSVLSSINYFFGRGELSQIVDQTNALSQLTHERRLSALGPGGLNRRRAGFEVRDVHISHYGRICPIETPEGTNIGLISSLAIFATVDEYGFLLTPYLKVKNGKVTEDVHYLRADEDMKTIIAAPSTVDQNTGKLQQGTVLAMKGGELAQVFSNEVDFVDVSSKQIVGISASLIPFLEHDDANRALMGSNMQRQAVPLLKTEMPLVGTGMEELVGQNSSMVVRAEDSGVVTAVDATRIILNYTDEYKLAKFVGLNERTCLNQKPVVKLGDKVTKNQVIADGGGTDNGVLALGKNVLVGFVSFDGFNFEDAIIVSEKLVKNDSFTSIHIDEFTAEVRETRLGREEFTNDIPNVSEKMLRNLDEHGVIREGTRVCPGDILVGKVVPKSKTELTPEEKLLHAIFGRAGEDVKNDSLDLPSGYEGVVIKTERFTRRGAGDEEAKNALKAQIRQYEQQMRAKECMVFRQMIEAVYSKFEATIVDPSTRQKVGASEDDDVIYEQIEGFDIKWVRPASIRDDVQKIVDKFRVKITEIQEEKKRRIDNLKHGDELPSGVLEMVKVYVAAKRTLSIGDKVAGRHGNKGVIAKIMPEENMPFLEDGTSLEILLNPLGVPSRMNVGQILETHLGWVAKVLGFTAITPVFDGAREDDIQKLTAEANEFVEKRKKELESDTIELGDTLFQRVYTISPESVKEDPGLRYDNKDNLKRHEWGEGPFCKFSIPLSYTESGIYVLVVGGHLAYIGKCDEPLSKRFNSGYGSIQPRNCFEGGQITNCRINTLILKAAQKGVSVELYFVIRNSERREFEQNLIDQYDPPWNVENTKRDKVRPYTEGKGVVVKRVVNKQPPSSDELFVTVPKGLKTQLYDGRTGEPFDQCATIGYIYMMKLHHLVDDKIHARATGPYSLITQQPLGGKTSTGGQRFGEMEVWALEGYGASYTLQEMLTVKSDDVEGRTKIYESMVKGQNTLEAGTPLSFDVLCNELRGLGLNIQLGKRRLGGTDF